MQTLLAMRPQQGLKRLLFTVQGLIVVLIMSQLQLFLLAPSLLCMWNHHCHDHERYAIYFVILPFIYLTNALIVYRFLAILTMRVYALYNRNRWIIVIASMLVLARLGVDLWVRLS